MSNQNFILILSGVIGIISGLAAVILKEAVHYIQAFLTEDFYVEYANFLYILYPIIGISAAFVLSKYVFKDLSGHGIPDVLFTISKQQSLIPRIKTYSRVITSALTVGFGGSVGLEAPMLVTGSAIGSNIGVSMHLNAKKRTLLIGCGAAGAISAIFGAPIGAVIFAIEVILMEISTASFIPLLIASVMGSLTSMVLIGRDQLFKFDLQGTFLASHMPYYLVLGILCGIISLYFSSAVMKTEKIMEGLESQLIRILYGGALLGFILFFFPPIYGEGYDTLNLLIEGNSDQLLDRSFFLSHSKSLSNSLFLSISHIDQAGSISPYLECRRGRRDFCSFAIRGGYFRFFVCLRQKYARLSYSASPGSFYPGGYVRSDGWSTACTTFCNFSHS